MSVQDEATPHASRLCQDYLHQAVINVIFWPSMGPDLKITESISSYMSRNINPTRILPQHAELFHQAVCQARVRRIIANLPQQLLVVVFHPNLNGRLNATINHIYVYDVCRAMTKTFNKFRVQSLLQNINYWYVEGAFEIKIRLLWSKGVHTHIHMFLSVSFLFITGPIERLRDTVDVPLRRRCDEKVYCDGKRNCGVHHPFDNNVYWKRCKNPRFIYVGWPLL